MMARFLLAFSGIKSQGLEGNGNFRHPFIRRIDHLREPLVVPGHIDSPDLSARFKVFPAAALTGDQELGLD